MQKGRVFGKVPVRMARLRPGEIQEVSHHHLRDMSMDGGSLTVVVSVRYPRCMPLAAGWNGASGQILSGLNRRRSARLVLHACKAIVRLRLSLYYFCTTKMTSSTYDVAHLNIT